MNTLIRTIIASLIFTISFQSSAQTFEGYALYNEMAQSNSYLIDRDGNIAHSWSCQTFANYSVKLKDNGNIVRGAIDWFSPIFGAAGGGILQELDPSANVVWEFDYSSATYLAHHDIEVLPNGNVLMIAWEVKSPSDVDQAGRNAALELWPTHIIEVQQNGSGGQIVWEWHVWDHLVQDIDSTKDNFDVVEDHPELLDINAVETFDASGEGDWLHVNGISYNADLDQIIFTSRTASEFFIIDHSTTTAEAASHAGGNSGMGGDFLYRWGNPSNYSPTALQVIPEAVHDPRWIPNDGRPNGGFIQFFNNGGGMNGGSAVDAIDPPVSGFNYTLSGSTYGPAAEDYRHECLADSWGQSASMTMSNGNLFVAVSNEFMYEIDANGNTVWQYNASPAKAFRYECDHPGIIALLGNNPCGLSLAEINPLADVNVHPNPSNDGVFYLDGLPTNGEVKIVVTNTFGQVSLETTNVSSIDLSNQADGMYFAKISFEGGFVTTYKLNVIN